MEFDNNEFSKHSAQTCYLTVIGAATPSPPSATSPSHAVRDEYTVRCMIQSEVASASEEGGDDLVRAQALCAEVSAGVDGGFISHQDRAALPQDEAALTYSETHCVPFIRLLRAAGARDGQVFYDLGCGAGDVLYIA